MSGCITYNEYDDDPWVYCSTCLSPKIKYEDTLGEDCCEDCGCTNICESTIKEWEEKYIKKYGHKYLEIDRNIKDTFVYQLSRSELMVKVANSHKCWDIIHTIYKNFPQGLSKTDAVVLFFDKLCKDNKVDDLRELLYVWRIAI